MGIPDYDGPSSHYKSPDISHGINPVLSTSLEVLKSSNVVQVNERGVKSAASYILTSLARNSYTPRSWRDHPLHICPPEPYQASSPGVKLTLDWIFLISSLNFSFWSPREGHADRYGIEWRSSWAAESSSSASTDWTIWTGYWSLVAALDRALEEGIPITDPAFYSSPERCPDSLIEHVFRPAPQCKETIPLLKERISIMRQNGSILCKNYRGSFQAFFENFQHNRKGHGTALDLVYAITNTFPTFRDETEFNGTRVFLWKRAQIFVAETWAAFYPAHDEFGLVPHHPLFPGPTGPAIHQLTMFADYRVPQILHHLGLLKYSPHLVHMLKTGADLPPGSYEEVAIRAASIVAVEKVRERMVEKQHVDHEYPSSLSSSKDAYEEEVSSVLIDFHLWDLAKAIEDNNEKIVGIDTVDILPAHRTRSIWY